MRIFILFLFLISCGSPGSNYNSKNKTINFNGNLSFDKFNELLSEYTKLSPFPNMDK